MSIVISFYIYLTLNPKLSTFQLRVSVFNPCQLEQGPKVQYYLFIFKQFESLALLPESEFSYISNRIRIIQDISYSMFISEGKNIIF